MLNASKNQQSEVFPYQDPRLRVCFHKRKCLGLLIHEKPPLTATVSGGGQLAFATAASLEGITRSVLPNTRFDPSTGW